MATQLWGYMIAMAFDKKGYNRCWAKGFLDLYTGEVHLQLCGFWLE